MHLRGVALLLCLIVFSGHLFAQAIPNSRGQDIPRVEVGANYNYFHVNAPPGQCGCFGMNGGSGTVILNVTPVWSVMADIAYAHANHVNGTAQNITTINYLFGPRYSRRNYKRFTPYAEILLGGAKEDVNFQFTINRQSFGFLAGGGVTMPLKRKFGLTIAEIDYVHTRIPNAKNDSQNNLRIATGITYRFGVR